MKSLEAEGICQPAAYKATNYCRYMSNYEFEALR
jgi:hypothetical protein